jgi:hypothetical protein
LTADGGTNPQGTNKAGIEASLDVQYAVGKLFCFWLHGLYVRNQSLILPFLGQALRLEFLLSFCLSAERTPSRALPPLCWTLRPSSMASIVLRRS